VYYMRGKFNNSCKIYKGPGTTTPGALVGTFPCRLVVEDGISTVGVGAPIIPRYLTIDAYRPVGAWLSPPLFGMDPALSDRVECPPGIGPQFWVLYTDIVIWHALTPYWRSYLCLLPAPGPNPHGGVIVNSQAIWDFIVASSGQGGVVASGSADRIVARYIFGSGGVELDSGATPAILRYFVGSGVSSSTPEQLPRLFTISSALGD